MFLRSHFLRVAHSSLSTQNSNPLMKPNGDLDLTRYKQPELIQTLSELTSITSALLAVIKPAIISASILIIASLILPFGPYAKYSKFHSVSESTYLVKRLIFLSVAILPALFLSGLFGTLSFTKRMGSNLRNLLILLIELFSMISKDIQYARQNASIENAKKFARVSTPKLLSAIIEQLLVPSLHTLVNAKLGFLAFLGDSLFQKIVDPSVRSLGAMVRKALDEDAESKFAEAPAEIEENNTEQPPVKAFDADEILAKVNVYAESKGINFNVWINKATNPISFLFKAAVITYFAFVTLIYFILRAF